MNQIAIEIKNYHYQVGEKNILNNINLSLNEKQVIGIIGPNGAGKTTLLKTINRLNIGQGEIKIFNKPINEFLEKELAQKVAFMHQKSQLSFPFTCKEVVEMGRYPYLKVGGKLSEKDKNIVENAIMTTNTEKFQMRKITSLSGGEMQRIMFAKVLAQDTSIILLDEPTASLDIRHEEMIFEYSRKLVDDGRTVLAVVHDLDLAAMYCDYLVLMHKGKVIAQGSCEEVLKSENIRRAYETEGIVVVDEYTGQKRFIRETWLKNSY